MESTEHGSTVKTLLMALVAFTLPLTTAMGLTGALVHGALASEPLPLGAVLLENTDPASEAAGPEQGTFVVGGPGQRRASGVTSTINGWTWRGPMQAELEVITPQGFWPREDLILVSDGLDHGRITVKRSHETLPGLILEVRRAP